MKKSEQNDLVRLQHMREAGEKAINFVDGKSRASLDEDEILVFALTHALTIIGEAANTITEPFRATHPQIPWAVIIGMRHRIVHAYFEVDLNIVWDTVTQNLPPLLKQIDLILPPGSELQ